MTGSTGSDENGVLGLTLLAFCRSGASVARPGYTLRGSMDPTKGAPRITIQRRMDNGTLNPDKDARLFGGYMDLDLTRSFCGTWTLEKFCTFFDVFDMAGQGFSLGPLHVDRTYLGTLASLEQDAGVELDRATLLSAASHILKRNEWHVDLRRRDTYSLPPGALAKIPRQTLIQFIARTGRMPLRLCEEQAGQPVSLPLFGQEVDAGVFLSKGPGPCADSTDITVNTRIVPNWRIDTTPSGGVFEQFRSDYTQRSFPAAVFTRILGVETTLSTPDGYMFDVTFPMAEHPRGRVPASEAGLLDMANARLSRSLTELPREAFIDRLKAVILANRPVRLAGKQASALIAAHRIETLTGALWSTNELKTVVTGLLQECPTDLKKLPVMEVLPLDRNGGPLQFAWPDRTRRFALEGPSGEGAPFPYPESVVALGRIPKRQDIVKMMRSDHRGAAAGPGRLF